ncbi:ImmA/IrrE family metallo-endopeptidase [Tumebacillus permanentifrigoris]|uniref:Uncharacterized protein DUF955 n=1 Tax=Tumebacillus permanentifrigoris TaxID=378543 RepID=A0A316D944_9BACL|nr:ImmA/IrrE family metallo-endopeptidase [Tumebacillus permanentifrigoris]PWK13496.1 uncharacterized protein DUF955 [Tumebacillus permanentifrigoris]
MSKIESTLRFHNQATYLEVELLALQDLSSKFRNRVLQQDLFRIVKELPDFHLLKFTIEDPELCAFAVHKADQNFIYVNTLHPADLQLFSLAHELYHVFHDEKYIRLSSDIVKRSETTYQDQDISEMRANCYAACLLMPRLYLEDEMLRLGMQRSAIELIDIVRLMDAFAVPYQAMVLRLWELEILNEAQARQFLAIPDRDRQQGVLNLINQTGYALQWQTVQDEHEYDQLRYLALENYRNQGISRRQVEGVFSIMNLSVDTFTGNKGREG